MTHKKCSPSLIRVSLLCAVALTLAVPASAEWKEKVLYSFQGVTDGATPVGGVVFDSAGNLYGATQDGGSANCLSIYQCGTVYQLAPPAKKGDPWTETVLYVFKGNASNDGASPFGGLVMDGAGNLYGTTAYGGTGDCVLLGSKLGCGAVYELSPPTEKGGAWTETVLYSFPSAEQGYVPWGDLVFDGAGNLYGSTIFGGGKGTSCDPYYQHCGAVFELSPPKTKGGEWTEKMLHGFASGTDGASPNGGLVLDSKGAIYGTTYGGGNESRECGSGGCGTAFELKPPTKKGGAWTETILHRFSGSPDGGGPMSGVVFDAKGSVYGTTQGGGRDDSGSGTVFSLSPGTDGLWTERILHSFQDGDDGAQPRAGVVFDTKGNIYGTASIGGLGRGGTSFKLRPAGKSWSLVVLHAFTGKPDGSWPASSLIFDAAGNLYGTTQQSGTGQACGNYGCGTVFEVSP
jgi:uncharacterized repeat protein (TIGR03803 family)